nr:MAG TPA: hypothetical protein [Caudoviricetes sp.]
MYRPITALPHTQRMKSIYLLREQNIAMESLFILAALG